MPDAGRKPFDATAERTRRVQRGHFRTASVARERLEDTLVDQRAAYGIGLVGGSAARAQVRDLSGRAEPHLPSRLSHPEAPVEILAVEEEPLGQQSGLLHGVPPADQRRAPR